MATRRLPLARTGLATALVAWAVLPSDVAEEPPVTAPACGEVEAPAWVVDVRDTPEGRLMLGKELVVPEKPLKGQRRAPCPGGYTTINGGCWIRADHQPPCHDTFWRSGQGCYLPLMGATPGTSIGLE